MPRKPATKKVEPKTTKKKKEVASEPIISGKVEGNYTTTVYENGDKISFEIDWDKLKQHVASAKS